MKLKDKLAANENRLGKSAQTRSKSEWQIIKKVHTQMNEVNKAEAQLDEHIAMMSPRKPLDMESAFLDALASMDDKSDTKMKEFMDVSLDVSGMHNSVQELLKVFERHAGDYTLAGQPFGDNTQKVLSQMPAQHSEAINLQSPNDRGMFLYGKEPLPLSGDDEESADTATWQTPEMTPTPNPMTSDSKKQQSSEVNVIKYKDMNDNDNDNDNKETDKDKTTLQVTTSIANERSTVSVQSINFDVDVRKKEKVTRVRGSSLILHAHSAHNSTESLMARLTVDNSKENLKSNSNNNNKEDPMLIIRVEQTPSMGPVMSSEGSTDQVMLRTASEEELDRICEKRVSMEQLFRCLKTCVSLIWTTRSLI